MNVARYEGRLFTDDGRLCMVIEADPESGIGRVSTRIDGQQQMLEMPLSEIGNKIAAAAGLTLDTVNSETQTARVIRKPDGWFFNAREGLKGPYQSSEAAERELNEYVISAQAS